jgi:hypothetical protein
MELELVTAPAAEPVTLAEAKSWSRVTSSGSDSDITLLLTAAREKCEAITGRKFITQSWRMWLDCWPRKGKDKWWDGTREGHISDTLGFATEIDLKLCPVISVSNLSYYLTDDTETVFSPSNYQVVGTQGAPGRVVLKFGQIWPSSVLRLANAIKIDFSVGYGSAGSAVPESIKLAIKALIAHLYEHRGDETEGAQVPKTVMELLNPFILRRV